MLDLRVPKIIAYLIKRVVLFLYSSSFPMHSTQETSFLDGVIMEIFSCLLDTFPVPASYFSVNLIVVAINNFHKQLYVKDS